MRTIWRLALLGLASGAAMGAVTALATPAGATPLYTVTDLGTLGGTSSFAQGVNEVGQWWAMPRRPATRRTTPSSTSTAR